MGWAWDGWDRTMAPTFSPPAVLMGAHTTRTAVESCGWFSCLLVGGFRVCFIAISFPAFLASVWRLVGSCFTADDDSEWNDGWWPRPAGRSVLPQSHTENGHSARQLRTTVVGPAKSDSFFSISFHLQVRTLLDRGVALRGGHWALGTGRAEVDGWRCSALGHWHLATSLQMEQSKKRDCS